LFDFFFHGHFPIHDPDPVEHETPGTDQRFLVKGAVIGHLLKLLVCQRGRFSQTSSASTSRRRDGVARHALGTPSDDCDSVRIGSFNLRIECPLPQALNRLPKSLLAKQFGVRQVRNPGIRQGSLGVR